VRKKEAGARPARSKKLLLPRGLHVAGQIPHRATGAGIKSLLVLFFRKEHAS
jgi:hypothetical protein